MSVVETVVVGGVFLVLASGVHELTRLYAIRHSLELMVSSRAGAEALKSLSHLSHGTFAPGVRENNPVEKSLKQASETLFQSSLLNWSWTSVERSSQTGTLSGVYASATGPHKEKPLAPVELSVTVCIQSWLEPLLSVLVDGRNCIGQYQSQKNSPTRRGISMRSSAKRSVPFFVPLYLFGVYEPDNAVPSK
ncbi:hypothetical protein EBU99_03210 [bacterium]|nr:hypothetical protein [bacterium]